MIISSAWSALRMGNPCPDGGHSKCDDRMANVASKLDAYVSACLRA